MRRVVLAVAAVAAVIASCKGSQGSRYAGAAVTAAAGVAMAGAYRAITHGCWASCRPGTRCDEASGLCVEMPCQNKCPPETRCVLLAGGAYECVRGSRDKASGVPEAEQAGPGPEADPCRGLCLTGEQCAVDAGVADCVPQPDAGT